MKLHEAAAFIRAANIEGFTDRILAGLKPSVSIRVDDDNSSSSAFSHFGGVPMVPRGFDWPIWDSRPFRQHRIDELSAKFKANPRAVGLGKIAERMRAEFPAGPKPLGFLAQISFKEVAAAAPLPGWPNNGSLAYFYDPEQNWGFDPIARGFCRVQYFAENEALVPANPPSTIPKEVQFPERKLRFEDSCTIDLDRTISDEDAKHINMDAYNALWDKIHGQKKSDTPLHRCGGDPQNIQGEMRLDCHLVTNGLYLGDSSGYKDPRRQELEAGAADWELLLQIDSDDKLGTMWGDAGRLYFWNRRQDIAANKYDNAWAILQCY